MNFRKNARAAKPALQMTAIMDVVFLLLCFFVTASVYSQWENEIDIALPDAATATPAKRDAAEITVNVKKGGAVAVNGAERGETELRAIFASIGKYAPGTPVFVRADKDAEYGAVVNVIDLCRECGISNFSLAALPHSGGEAEKNIKETNEGTIRNGL